MADLDLQSLGMRLGEAITPTPRDAPQVRYGTIDAVNADGTLDVTVDGTTLRGMCATTGCVGAQAGMRCVILRQGPLATVIGLVASTDLGDLTIPGDLTADGATFADIAHFNGRAYFANGKEIFGTTTGNALRQMMGLNVSDQLVIGYGGYANQDVPTYLEGNTVTLVSRGAINLNSNNFAVNYAPTDWAYLVGSASDTAKRVRYCKRGGAVFVEVWYESGAGVGTSNTLIATLPSGFRPSLQVETCAFGNADHVGMLRVNPGGTIYGKSMSGTMNYFKGAVSFPV